MKIVFLDAATVGADISLDPIARLGQLTCYPATAADDRIARIGDAEIVITNKVRIDSGVMDACPSLRLICEAATGTDNIDTVQARQRGISVRNVAGYSTASVVQLTMAVTLQLIHHIDRMDAYVKQGRYTDSRMFTCTAYPFSELAGKQWGIIGLGQIGRHVGEVAAAFGAHVAYYSTTGRNTSGKTFERMDLEELLRTSDVVSIHAPLNDRTRNLIDRHRLRLMKPTALIVNMGRGGIINEPDLAEALDEGLIAGAATDVFTQEPLPADHPFMHLRHPERMLFTPHIGWAATEARQRLVEGIAGNIADFIGQTSKDTPTA
ncbi:MAG: D-2-hydroxyacid dehydrogenase [Paludibacteraceae bacterium]|nr:D-2-hydroxyacid dehydrogenase [Paludibacteraceae bacterium]